MWTGLARQVRRVEVSDPIAAARAYDYADAFEVRLPEPDPFSPRTWVGAGLDTAPGWAQRIVELLGLRRAPDASADYVSDFRVVESGPEMIHLETALPLIHVVLVGRNVEPARRVLTTILHFERPVLARLVWAVVGVAHRRTARRVITSKVATVARR